MKAIVATRFLKNLFWTKTPESDKNSAPPSGKLGSEKLLYRNRPDLDQYAQGVVHNA